jgi:hypothetical protein
MIVISHCYVILLIDKLNLYNGHENDIFFDAEKNTFL